MNLSDYYMDVPLHEPPHIEQREFGVIKAKPTKENPKPPMWRHLSFQNIDKLRSFLIEHKPLHVYFSASRYENPSARPGKPGEPIMVDKVWLGSDLIFDIDNDALNIPTMAEAAYHAKKLDDLLRVRFGLEDRMMTFSGSRGYHVHVRDECIQTLSSNCRKDIADYFREFNPLKNGWKVYNKNYVCLDIPVTTTPSHLIRLPGSIHGKTMKPCRIMNI